jgi:hypothetical protein
MARVLAAALLLAALPALLAAPAPIPSEPTISDIIDDNNGIQFKWVPAVNSTAATMTCDVACGRQGNGWASVSGGAPNRTLCTFTNGTSVFVGERLCFLMSYCAIGIDAFMAKRAADALPLELQRPNCSAVAT